MREQSRRRRLDLHQGASATLRIQDAAHFNARCRKGRDTATAMTSDTGQALSPAHRSGACQALQLKREWSPWPEFGSDPGNPRELRLASHAQASLPRSWPTPELRIPNAAAQTRTTKSPILIGRSAKEDQTGHEIVDHALQAEADTDGERSS
jgi:hypothetical protein